MRGETFLEERTASPNVMNLLHQQNLFYNIYTAWIWRKFFHKQYMWRAERPPGFFSYCCCLCIYAGLWMTRIYSHTTRKSWGLGSGWGCADKIRWICYKANYLLWFKKKRKKGEKKSKCSWKQIDSRLLRAGWGKPWNGAVSSCSSFPTLGVQSVCCTGSDLWTQESPSAGHYLRPLGLEQG